MGNYSLYLYFEIAGIYFVSLLFGMGVYIYGDYDMIPNNNWKEGILLPTSIIRFCVIRHKKVRKYPKC